MGNFGYGGPHSAVLGGASGLEDFLDSKECNLQAHLLATWAARFSLVGFIPLFDVSEHIRVCDMHPDFGLVIFKVWFSKKKNKSTESTNLDTVSLYGGYNSQWFSHV